MKKLLVIKKLSSLMIFCLALGLFLTSADQNKNLVSAASPDVIAIRIVPNPEHMGVLEWYQAKGFTGSPQALKVDGYDAVRDGRTVYVNAANIVGTCTSNPSKSCGQDTDCSGGSCQLNKFYSNIYIISYNQNPEQQTIDIFGRILVSWKFNTNLKYPGECVSTKEIGCLNDNECPEGEYCTSKKARLVRDTKRLADIYNLNKALEKYRSAYGYYPKLLSGSYLPGATVSTWPSWQQTFGRALGITLAVDPVNGLGPCSSDRFHPLTCWDDTAKEFDGQLPDNMPAGSRAYVYTTNQGEDFIMCSQFETEYDMDYDSCR